MVDLLNVNNYMSYWYGVRKGCHSDVSAYEQVETECMMTYGVGMYENFGAFRTAMHRYRGKLYDAIHSDHIHSDTVRDILTIPGYMEAHRRVKYERADGRVLSDEDAWEILEQEIQDKYGVSYCDNFNHFRITKRRYAQAMMRKGQKALVYRLWKGKR